jgi:chromosome segregation ATPase
MLAARDFPLEPQFPQIANDRAILTQRANRLRRYSVRRRFASLPDPRRVMQATFVKPEISSRMLPVSAVATRIPDGHGAARVQEILQLLDGLPSPESAESRHALSELDRDRRRLNHALTMLKSARQRLHQQYLESDEEKKQLLQELRREWNARRRALESQLAAAALRKAREELDEERAHLEAEFHQRQIEWEQQQRQIEHDWQADLAAQRQQHESERLRVEADSRRMQSELENERRLLQVERDRLAAEQRQSAGREQHRGEVERQLADVRQKLVQSELALVQERSRHAAERRDWAVERNRAEGVIRDLLAEVQAATAAAQPPARSEA